MLKVYIPIKHNINIMVDVSHHPLTDHQRFYPSEGTDLILFVRYQVTLSRIKLLDPRRNVWAMGPCEDLEPVESESVPHIWIVVHNTISGQNRFFYNGPQPSAFNRSSN